MDEDINAPIKPLDSPVILPSEVMLPIEPQQKIGLPKIILATSILLIILATTFGFLYLQAAPKTTDGAKTNETALNNHTVTPIDRANAVAIINGKPIMRADFEKELESYREYKKTLGPALEEPIEFQSPPSKGYSPGTSLLTLGAERMTLISKLEGKEAESAILDSMIWEELLIQEAEKENLSMSEKQLDGILRSYFGDEFVSALSVPEQDLKIHGYSPISEGTGLEFALGQIGGDDGAMSQLAKGYTSMSIAKRSQVRERLRRTFTIKKYHQKISTSAATNNDENSFDEEALVETLRNQSNAEILLDGYIKPQPVAERRKDQLIRSSISNLLFGINSYFSNKGTYVGMQSSILQSNKEDIQTIVENGGSPAHLIIQERENAWCASSTLNSGKKFCLDSTGRGVEGTSYCTNAACPGSPRDSIRLREFKDINGLSFSYPENWKQSNFASQGTIHITLNPLNDEKNTIIVNSSPSTGQEREIESFLAVKSSEMTAGGVTWKVTNLDESTQSLTLAFPNQKITTASYKDLNKSISYSIEASYEKKNEAQMQEAFTKILQSVRFK